jgi:predicted DNA-binding transcriptional regulator AlpA
MTNETYLTPREAAAYLKSSTSTLAKRRLRGLEPKYYRIGRAIRYRKIDLDEFITLTAVQSPSKTVRGPR